MTQSTYLVDGRLKTHAVVEHTLFSDWVPISQFLYLLPPPVQWIPGALSLGVKRQGRESDHSPPSSAEVKEWAELYFHSTNTPSWRGAQSKKAQGQLYLYLCSVGTRGSLSGVKRLGREADNSPLSSAEVKECVELYLYSPIRLHGVVLS
jgi:hypothetical protein